ncbi:hypothetical protein KSF78_0002929 [Schistosoma japonicum]|nr:hypothetical protein KSF78_0002929 [Schistosoma japonicum]
MHTTLWATKITWCDTIIISLELIWKCMQHNLELWALKMNLERNLASFTTQTLNNSSKTYRIYINPVNFVFSCFLICTISGGFGSHPMSNMFPILELGQYEPKN